MGFALPTFAQQGDNFHDVSELLFIQQQLGDYDSKVFKTTLQLAVKGPILLADETPGTSDARNRVFELAIAGRLRQADFKPRFVEPGRFGGLSRLVRESRPSAMNQSR